ncbi:hypothetical protein MKW98_011190 [Papaver atlanticum]|uniref:Uncharacterized protein n=1 Tax=Papaver atlanticum TaxID=357466 RepID=A0AAD4S2P7_9MAGN|nr:hypothetical protein MKW98_011190 [Papaver atlanticum]
MTNRFKGFARMLSTGKNSTIKGGIRRIARRVKREVNIEVIKALSAGLALGTIYNYFDNGDEDRRNLASQPETVPVQIQAMNFKR